MDPNDFLAYLTEGNPEALARSAAMAKMFGRQQALGQLDSIVGGPFAGSGRAMALDADQTMQAMQKGALARESDLLATRRLDLLGQKMGGKGNSLTMHGKVQFKTNPGTGESFYLDSDSGQTWYVDGRPRTAPFRVAPEAPSVTPTATQTAPPYTGQGRSTQPLLRPPGTPAPAPGPAVVPTPTTTPPAEGGPAAPPAAPVGPTLLQPKGERLYGKVLQKELTDFGNDLDPNKGTGEIASNQRRLNAALRLRALVTNPDGSVKTNIPPQFMKETAAALAQLVNAGGVPAQSLIEELTPHTGSSDIAQGLQWLTANPTDAGQQKFVELYLESANREAEVAQQALDKAIQGRAGKRLRLFRGNPEEAQAAARAQGWEITPEGSLRRIGGKPEGGHSTPTADAQDQKAMEWLQANPNHPSASGVRAKLKAKGLVP